MAIDKERETIIQAILEEIAMRSNYPTAVSVNEKIKRRYWM